MVHRYTRTNNKYMEKFNDLEDSTYLQYLDANNLYGWAMSQLLLTWGFEWMLIEPHEGEAAQAQIGDLSKQQRLHP